MVGGGEEEFIAGARRLWRNVETVHRTVSLSQSKAPLPFLVRFPCIIKNPRTLLGGGFFGGGEAPTVIDTISRKELNHRENRRF